MTLRARATARIGALILSAPAAFYNAAEAADRIVSIGESPYTAVADAQGGHGMLVDLVHALDRVTHSTSTIVLRPFARSLSETAADKADVHIPFIQNDGEPPPNGLAYVNGVDLGETHFVIYSRKQAPLDARTVARHRIVEVEPGHASFFPFPVQPTYCVPCSLDKLSLGRIDALIVSSDIVDPLLKDAKYGGIHRALYKTYTVRALVPANVDSSKTREYLIQGLTELKKTGEMWKITKGNQPYSDWQP
jgi:hypothetical protein